MSDGRTLLRERDVWITTERAALGDRSCPVADLERVEIFETPGARTLDAVLAVIAFAVVTGCAVIGVTMGFDRGGLLLTVAVGAVGPVSLLASVLLGLRAWGNGPRHGLVLVLHGERDLQYSSTDRAFVERVHDVLARVLREAPRDSASLEAGP